MNDAAMGDTAMPSEPGPTEPPPGGGIPQMVLDDPQQLVGSTILGRFKVEGVLGQGGMGAVLRCHHKGLQRDIAVKVLHPEMSSNREVSARFAREAQTMSRLNHPNCVRVLDFGEFEVGGHSMQYLAMELLSGCELSELMLRPLSAARAMELMDQILAGLEHAHAAGVVHRDLKPENVFVTTDHDGRELLKIVDFGIAKIVTGQGAKDNMTVAGTIFGTPRYMSPEQCAGGEIDARTDVYAAGIILYEMLAGHVPFDDVEDPMRVIHKHILEPVPPLPSTVPDVLAQLVSQMLEKEKAHRLASVAEARERVREIQRALATGAAMARGSATLLPQVTGSGAATVVRVGVPSGPVAVLPRRSSPARWALPAVGGLLVVGGIVAALATGGDDEPPASTEEPVDVAAVGDEPKGELDGAVPAAVEPVLEVLGATEPGADEDKLAEIDRLLGEGNFDGAAELIRRQLDRFPKDPQLHLRQARALRVKQGAKALHAYATALELDKRLVADEKIRAEVLALMTRAELEEPALDLAIRQLGEHGVTFLLERVNDESRPPAYTDRHRALRTIEDADRGDAVNHELNLALDLWQAEDAAEPCDVYSEALDRIQHEPSAYYIGSVMRSRPPSKCIELEAKRTSAGESLQAQFLIAETDWQVPAAYAKKKRKRGGSRGGLLRRMGLR